MVSIRHARVPRIKCCKFVYEAVRLPYSYQNQCSPLLYDCGCNIICDLIPQSQIETDHRPISIRRIFYAHRTGDRPMIAWAPGHCVASGGVLINFKSHLKFYPSLGPGRNRVEIETRSDTQRTVIARRSPDKGFMERVSEK